MKVKDMAEEVDSQKMMGFIVPPGFEADILKAQQLEEQAQHNPAALIPLIQTYEKIVKRLQPGEYLNVYAAAHYQLGEAYGKRPTGNLAADMTHAIACYRKALRFWIPEAAPLGYAMTQYNLGLAYCELPTGDRAANLAQAIHATKKPCASRHPRPSHLNAAGSPATWLICTLLKEHGMQRFVPIVLR